MLIHRCYTIYGSRKGIAWFLIVISVISNGLLLVDSILQPYGSTNTQDPTKSALLAKNILIDTAAVVVVAIANLIITLTTATRIWLITKQTQAVLGKQIYSRPLRQITVIVLESGILYPLAAILAQTIILSSERHHGLLPFDPTVTLMAGIAPTLIIVRAASKKSVESVHQMVSTLRFAERNDYPAHESRESVSMGLESSLDKRIFPSLQALTRARTL